MENLLRGKSGVMSMTLDRTRGLGGLSRAACFPLGLYVAEGIGRLYKDDVSRESVEEPNSPSFRAS